MPASKLQTTAIVIVALLLLAIPLALFIRNSQTAAPTPTATDADSATTDPDEIDFLAPYTPHDEEPLKFVTAPPAIRTTLFQHLTHRHRAELPAGHMVIRWDPHHPYYAGNYTDAPVTPEDLIGGTLSLTSPQMEVSPALAKTPLKLPGDIVIRENPHLEQSLPPLEKLFQQQFHLALKLSFRDVQRKVIVFKGHWTPTPHPNSPPSEYPIVQIYINTVEKNRDADSFPTGAQSNVAAAISETIHHEVLIETDNPPPLIRYQFNDASDTDTTVPNRTPNTLIQINAILKHISDQTALPWSVETRTVHHLFIDPIP